MVTLEQRRLYADRIGRVWAKRYRVPPITGRAIGYLLVCDPPAQSINELAEALQASRSAIAGSVKDLEVLGLLRRRRAPGERVDRVWIVFDEARGFDPERYREAAALAREGLQVLPERSTDQRAQLENMASLNEFLAERLPKMLGEWQQERSRGPSGGSVDQVTPA
jgi:DNA-binding MarR family transcriptional regulator